MANEYAGVTFIFDLDGTLVDTAADLAASMNHALACADCAPVDAEKVRHLVGHGARRMLAMGFELSHGAPADDAALDDGLVHFLNHYESNIAVHSRPFPGAIHLLERFAEAGVKHAICTNKREHLAVRLLDELGLVKYFDIIVGADTVGVAKPDPAPVLRCLDATAARRGIFFGDSDTDIRAAAAAALPCFIASFGYGPVTLADRAAGVFDHYRDADALVRARLSGD